MEQNNNQNPITLPESRSIFDANRLTIKGLVVVAIVLLLLIPSALVNNLVNERAARRDQVVQEVSSKWATAQTVSGPLLTVPYTLTKTSSDGKPVTYNRFLYLLPNQLKIDGNIQPELKHRSIYTVALYRSDLQLTGSFTKLSEVAQKNPEAEIHWSQAFVSMGVTDAKGLEDKVEMQWNGGTYTLAPGQAAGMALGHKLMARMPLTGNETPNYAIGVKLRGSEALYFQPLGSTTEVHVKSPWRHPSFDGQFLPAASNADEKGFTASWKVTQASRAYGEVSFDGEPPVANSAFGTRLVQPADGYVRVQRAAKYSILFIALTFTIFFFLEILRKQRVHPLQYTLLGLALVVFYTLLLAFSEYFGFNIAYFIAAAATVGLIGAYVYSLFHSGKTALSFTSALGALYAYIFIIIQMEDLSLLFGSVGLFVIIGILMYFTRKVDWYNTNSASPNLAR